MKYEYDTIYGKHKKYNQTIDLEFGREIIHAMHLTEKDKEIVYVGLKIDKLNKTLKETNKFIEK